MLRHKGNFICNGTTSPTTSPVYLTGIFVTLSVTGILAATLGNSLILLAVYKTNSLRVPANYLLVSLSLASLLFVPVLTTYAISLTMTECEAAMLRLCSRFSKLDFALFCVVMSHLAIISLDRLIAIKMPMRYVENISSSSKYGSLTFLCYCLLA